MQNQKKAELDRRCENCVYFLQHYIRLPDDDDSVTFLKCEIGDCANESGKISKANYICDNYMEYAPGLLEKIVLSGPD